VNKIASFPAISDFSAIPNAFALVRLLHADQLKVTNYNLKEKNELVIVF
jgi:hypothetical protein